MSALTLWWSDRAKNLDLHVSDDSKEKNLKFSRIDREWFVTPSEKEISKEWKQKYLGIRKWVDAPSIYTYKTMPYCWVIRKTGFNTSMHTFAISFIVLILWVRGFFLFIVVILLIRLSTLVSKATTDGRMEKRINESGEKNKRVQHDRICYCECWTLNIEYCLNIVFKLVLLRVAHCSTKKHTRPIPRPTWSREHMMQKNTGSK